MFTSAKHDTKVFNDKNAYKILVLNWYDLSKVCVNSLKSYKWTLTKHITVKLLNFVDTKCRGNATLDTFVEILNSWIALPTKYTKLSVLKCI